MTTSRRRALLFLALAGVVGWSLWLAFGETENAGVDVAEPVTRARSPAPAETAAPVQPPEAAPRLALSRSNLFPQQTWYVPPPPPPPQPYVAPPPPQAPSLPFSYMGRWQEAGQTTYYLARGTLPVSVRAGQVLDGVWRLEPVTGGQLNFTYLPLDQTRSLRTGD
ncbi:MAG: hypothetical protein Q8R61_08035 [Thiobacillus sp.]|uniref:hypothetical protein n=1 Tax=Thiobacillus sp. TaxID=924 RepID=UPI002736D0EC|nr:hypothetical protein [Thiobacillus sp.]MDP3585059.1 hypothetical protein [Thiobacillus sp.]